MHLRTTLAAALLLTGSAQAQHVLDGDFDNLPVGTAPDCGTPAGAWQFPPNYITAFVCETDPTQFEIVPTASFQPGAPGNSLHLNTANPNIDAHLVNLFDTVIQEAFCEFAIVTFRIWVPAAAPAGGSVYVGGDHGGGGFYNLTDRGPQLSWRGDGTIAYGSPDPITGEPVFTTLVGGYPRDAWQTVTIEISLGSDHYDVYWAPAGQMPQRVGDNLPFRSPGNLTLLDRFTVAHFGANFPAVECYLDDLMVVRAAPACYPNCDGSTVNPFLNVADFTCFLQRFAAGDPYANCDGSSAPPVLNVADFTCFLQRFAAGCDC